MKIDYHKILNNNMINIFKDVLKYIEKNGLHEGHHLYITFNTRNIDTKIPDWLKEKYPKEMTIVIQYEFWNFRVKKNSFNIGLSFNNIKTDLNIPFHSVISFADPYANFGLRLIQDEKEKSKKIKTKSKTKKKKIIKQNIDNIIDFKKFKKN